MTFQILLVLLLLPRGAGHPAGQGGGARRRGEDGDVRAAGSGGAPGEKLFRHTTINFKLFYLVLLKPFSTDDEQRAYFSRSSLELSAKNVCL